MRAPTVGADPGGLCLALEVCTGADGGQVLFADAAECDSIERVKSVSRITPRGVKLTGPKDTGALANDESAPLTNAVGHGLPPNVTKGAFMVSIPRESDAVFHVMWVPLGPRSGNLWRDMSVVPL